MKNNEMWIIKGGGVFLPYTVKATKTQCIQDFCISYCRSDKEDIKSEWEYRKKHDYSCVKIRVEEI